MHPPAWYSVQNINEVPSPALLIYPDRVAENVRRMIGIAGQAQRLWPHIKTHKLPELIRAQMDHGIAKFKCATIAEAEMLAQCAVAEVLLAYKAVGPNISRLLRLMIGFPKVRFSTSVDDATVVGELSRAASAAKVSLNVLIDLDCGMHR